MDDKSVYSQSVTQTNTNPEAYIVKPLEDFNMPNMKEPNERIRGGCWIAENDFVTCFEYVQMYYDPTRYPHNEIITIETDYYNDFTESEEHEIIIIERLAEEPKDKKIRFYFGFAPHHAIKKTIHPAPYCILHLYDFERFQYAHSYKTLNSILDGVHLTLENQNHVLNISTLSPVSYSYFISSDSKFSTMSFHKYLTTYENYISKIFPVEYPAMSKGKYLVVSKFKLHNIVQKGSLLIKARIPNEAALLTKNFRVRVSELPSNPFNTMLKTVEGLEKNLYETTHYLTGYVKLKFIKDSSYIITIEGTSQANTSEGSFDLMFLSKEGYCQIDMIDMVEPVFYHDVYFPSKYGVILREKIFVGVETHAAFYLKISRGEASNASGNLALAGGRGAPKKPTQIEPSTATLKSGQDQVENDGLKRRLTLQLLDENDLVIESTGLGYALLSNVQLYSSKDDPAPEYYLQAKFDVRDWPECVIVNELTKNIEWDLYVFSTDTVGLVRDNAKEDHEKEIKKTWEDKEPGRAERAKKSRMKFILHQRKVNGENLTEAELELLNEPRPQKPSKEELAAMMMGQKGGMKPPMQKGAAPQQTQLNAQKKPVLIPGQKPVPTGNNTTVSNEEKRPFSKSINTVTKEFQDFLIRMEAPRVVEQKPLHQGLVHVKSDSQRSEDREKMALSKEDWLLLIAKLLQTLSELKSHQENELNALKENFNLYRKNFKAESEGIYKDRDELRVRRDRKKEKEKKLIDSCLIDRPVEQDLDRLLKEYFEEKEYDPILAELTYRVMSNSRIWALIDRFRLAVQNYELNEIKECLDEVNRFNLDIEENLLEKANEIVAEASENPNYIAERQAEMKKQGGKKPAPGKK
jgi:hypothetical protein